MLVEILGYVLGLLVGFIMGMLGGGGSLLLPVMLYLLHKDVSLATAYTTILVGMTAFIGAFDRFKRREIDWPTVVALGIPVSLGMLLVRGWLFELVPNELFKIGSFVVTKQTFVLTLFAAILLLSFATMIGLIGRNLKPRPDFRQQHPQAYFLLLGVCGLLIGIIPGFTGAGGGVLIVPLLVIFFGTPMKPVIGTSLTIIAAKSLIGFFGGDVLRLGSQIEWTFLSGFAVVMIIGVLIGSHVAQHVDGRKLKLGFAWFVLALALFILIKEFIVV